MPSYFAKQLIYPQIPNNAAGFIDDTLTVIDLRRSRRGFQIASCAATELPPGLLVPSFDSQNIADPAEMAGVVSQTLEAAGLRGKKNWSVALPEGVAKTLVITLDSKPANRNELKEVISWKIERALAVKTASLRLARQRLSPLAGQDRYLVTAAWEETLAEYEELFAILGWRAGLVVPRHLGEAEWLSWTAFDGDGMLVSVNRTGFTSMIVRKGEPVIIRSHDCELAALADELYRVALYYRDRVQNVKGVQNEISSVLFLGEVDRDGSLKAIADATGSTPRIIGPQDFGFDLSDEAIRFDQLAAAAGLATQAWR